MIATAQFPLNDRARNPSLQLAAMRPEGGKIAADVLEEGILRLKSGDAEVRFDVKTGTLVGLVCNGIEHIHEGNGPVFNWYRAINNSPRAWENGLVVLKDFAWKLAGDRSSATIVAELEANIGQGEAIPHTLEYTVYGNGAVDVDARFHTPSDFSHARLGLSMMLPSGFDNAQWFGRGPMENYPDRKSAAYIGAYSANVDAMSEHYVRAQSMGGREDARWLVLADSEGNGLKFTAATTFGFSALHHTDHDLWEATYGHNLPSIRRNEVVLNLDCVQEGLGNASCGPGPRDRYRIARNKDYGYSFRMEPL